MTALHGTPGRTGTPSASARGVNSSTITVGVPTINVAVTSVSAGGSLGALKDFNEQAAWQAYFDEANATPIGGRTIKAVYDSYNPLDYNDTQRSCKAVTDDQPTFAVLALNFFGDAVTCVTAQHREILLNALSEAQDSVWEQAQGRYVSEEFSATRILRGATLDLDRQGALTGKNIGVLTAQGGNDNVPVDHVLIPLLKQLGRKVVHESTLAGDFGTAQSQIPVEVAQMRSAGVDTLFLGTNALYFASFTQEADRQGWKPQYIVTDYSDATNEAFVSSYPNSVDGAIGITTRRYGEHVVGMPEAPNDAKCAAIYAKRTGKSLTRGNAVYSFVVEICSLVLDIFVPALRDAGAALSQASWIAGVGHIGDFAMGFSGPASLRPGKLDAASSVRTLKFFADCKCWHPMDAFRTVP